MKIVAFDGKHKLANKWEDEPYIVLSQPNSDVPVYVVRKETGEGRERILNRNLLLPIGNLTQTEEQQKLIPKPRQKKGKLHQPNSIDNTDDILLSDEEDDGFVLLELDSSTSNTNNHTEENPGTDMENADVQEPKDTDDSDVQEPVDTDANDETAEEEDEETVVDDDNDEGAHQSSSGEEDPHESPPSARPVRTKSKPLWMKSGEFICTQQASKTEWLTRANYLKDLLDKVPIGKAEELYSAILKIVSDG